MIPQINMRALASVAALLLLVAGRAERAHTQDWAAAKYEVTEKLQKELGIARSNALLGAEDGAGTAMTKKNFAADYLDRVVLPRMRAAKTCHQYKGALAEYLGFERQRQLLGTAPKGAEPHDAAVAAFGRRFFEVCETEAYERCKTDHDLGLVAFLMQMARLRELLGVEDPQSERRRDELARKCYNFELEFEATTPASSEPSQSRLTAKMVVPFNLWTGQGGKAPITFENVSIWQELNGVLGRCQIVGALPVVTAEIQAIDGDFVQVDPDNPKTALFGKSKFLELNVHLEHSGDGEVQADCPGGPGTYHIWFWPDVVHDEKTSSTERSEDAGTPRIVLRFRDFHGEIPARDVYAQRIYTPNENLDAHAYARLRQKPL